MIALTGVQVLTAVLVVSGCILYLSMWAFFTGKLIDKHGELMALFFAICWPLTVPWLYFIRMMNFAEAKGKKSKSL